MRRAFVSIASSYVGCCVAGDLHRRGYEVVGSIRDEDNEDIEGIVSQTADANDERGTLSLALLSDVIVLCLIEDIRGADAVLTALHFMKDDVGGPCHLLVLSTTMTWAKTKIPPPKACFLEDTFAPSSLLRPASMVPTSNSNQRPATNNMGPGGPSALPRTASPVVNSGTASPSREASRQQRIAGQGGGSSPSRSTSPHRAVATSTTSFRRRQPDHLSEPCFIEEDYILRKPPSGFLEHKRLEDAALRLRSPALSACVVGGGVPYGVGEGPLLRLFREAWMQRDGIPVRLPTSTAGNNRLALINVLDLSAVVGELLPPPTTTALKHPNVPLAPFPKPYILAVDGNNSQPTAKEATEALAKAFAGASGETKPMEPEELEEVLVDDPSALALLCDQQYSNDGGVVANMVARGRLEPVTWSTGFVASAKQLAREFVMCRSLHPIRAVVLGPPGAGQELVCEKISKRYGLMRVDAKVAADGVFSALGKPLPERVPPEEKSASAAKGKKGKDAKKATGLNKGEQSAEALAALAELSPTERLMHDIQVAFEAADFPLTEYTTLDAGGLCRILSPSIVATAARLLLEETRGQWAQRGYILCDIPSRDDCISTIFEEEQQSSSSSTSSLRPAADGGSGGGSSGPVGENDSDGVGPSSQNPPASDAASVADNSLSSSLVPTHVTYLHASAEFILSEDGAARQTDKPEQSTSASAVAAAGAKIQPEEKLQQAIEQYFESERNSMNSQRVVGGVEVQPMVESSKKASLPSSENVMAEEGVAEDDAATPPWLPATAMALQNEFSAKTQAVDAEVDLPSLVDAVDLQLTGGETPAFVRMLAGEGIGQADLASSGDPESARMERKRSLDDAEHKNNTIRVQSAPSHGGGDELHPTTGAPDDKEEVVTTTTTADCHALMGVLAKLTARDAKEVESRTRRHRAYLTESVVPQIAAGLLAAAEVRPADPFEFLASYLIREGQALQRRAEAEAELKYRAGIALLRELEEKEGAGILASDSLRR